MLLKGLASYDLMYDEVQIMLQNKEGLFLTPQGLIKHDETLYVDHKDRLSMSREDAVALVNSLYYAGIRPTVKSEDTKGELKATQNHLKDMRQLAFHTLEVEKPIL